MSSDIELGKCDICGEYDTLSRKYYYYNIKCKCCGSPWGHFEIVKYCKNCTPKPPKKITLCADPIEIME